MLAGLRIHRLFPAKEVWTWPKKWAKLNLALWFRIRISVGIWGVTFHCYSSRSNLTHMIRNKEWNFKVDIIIVLLNLGLQLPVVKSYYILSFIQYIIYICVCLCVRVCVIHLLYIYIYIYIYICIFRQHFFVNANFIKHNRHFMPTYFLLDPFEFPYYFYRIRGKLI